jgi:LysM repeat protein
MRYTILFLFLLLQNINFAQTIPLIAQLDDQSKPFLIHVVGTKENFYSIGRTYNISPKLFAPYNGLELTSGLSIGQKIKIPLNETNFWQKGTQTGSLYRVPVYHQVKTNESLTKISNSYAIEKRIIVSWNNLPKEEVGVGEKIIIGFLLVDKNLSALAAEGVGPRSEPSFMNAPRKDKIPAIQTNPAEKKDTPLVNKKIEETPVPVQKNPTTPKIDESLQTYSGAGYFKDEYERQTNKGRIVQANNYKGGVFKSTSGWTDGKFYILIDGIEKGTIVQLTNLANNKKVYAKVLATIAETKPGASESFLISNATTAQLEITSANFELEISWEK